MSEELDALKVRIAAAKAQGALVAPDSTTPPIFLRSSLRSAQFFADHAAEIEVAARENRIIDDVSHARPKLGKAWGAKS